MSSKAIAAATTQCVIPPLHLWASGREFSHPISQAETYSLPPSFLQFRIQYASIGALLEPSSTSRLDV